MEDKRTGERGKCLHTVCYIRNYRSMIEIRTEADSVQMEESKEKTWLAEFPTHHILHMKVTQRVFSSTLVWW